MPRWTLIRSSLISLVHVPEKHRLGDHNNNGEKFVVFVASNALHCSSTEFAMRQETSKWTSITSWSQRNILHNNMEFIIAGQECWFAANNDNFSTEYSNMEVFGKLRQSFGIRSFPSKTSSTIMDCLRCERNSSPYNIWWSSLSRGMANHHIMWIWIIPSNKSEILSVINALKRGTSLQSSCWNLKAL